MKQIVVFLAFMTFIGCKDEELPEGGLQELGLETTEITSEAQDSLFTVNIKNPYWYLYKTEDIVGKQYTVTENTFYWKTANGNRYQAYHDTLSGNWFEVSKNASNKMTIKLTKNTTSHDRKLLLYITGNEIESDILTITQKCYSIE